MPPNAPFARLDDVLRPIPGRAPAGGDLRATPALRSKFFDPIKTARGDAAELEESRRTGMIEDGREEEKEHWEKVLTLGHKALAEKSKDLRIAAWVTDALTRLHGFAGLANGLRLCRGLVETFWEGLHPGPDLSERLAPLAALDGGEEPSRLVQALRELPLLGGRAPSTRAELESLSAVDLAARVAQAPPEQREAARKDLRAALEALTELERALAERVDSDAAPVPPFPALRRALNGCLGLLDEGGPRQPGGPIVGVNGPVNGPVSHAVATREEAFVVLKAVAAFFRRTEPHSPVSYLLEQAVRWGDLPLPKLLAELLPEEGTRSQVFTRIGIRPPEEDPDADEEQDD